MKTNFTCDETFANYKELASQRKIIVETWESAHIPVTRGQQRHWQTTAN